MADYTKEIITEVTASPSKNKAVAKKRLAPNRVIIDTGGSYSGSGDNPASGGDKIQTFTLNEPRLVAGIWVTIWKYNYNAPDVVWELSIRDWNGSAPGTIRNTQRFTIPSSQAYDSKIPFWIGFDTPVMIQTGTSALNFHSVDNLAGFSMVITPTSYSGGNYYYLFNGNWTIMAAGWDVIFKMEEDIFSLSSKKTKKTQAIMVPQPYPASLDSLNGVDPYQNVGIFKNATLGQSFDIPYDMQITGASFALGRSAVMRTDIVPITISLHKCNLTGDPIAGNPSLASKTFNVTSGQVLIYPSYSFVNFPFNSSIAVSKGRYIFVVTMTASFVNHIYWAYKGSGPYPSAKAYYNWAPGEDFAIRNYGTKIPVIVDALGTSSSGYKSVSNNLITGLAVATAQAIKLVNKLSTPIINTSSFFLKNIVKYIHLATVNIGTPHAVREVEIIVSADVTQVPSKEKVVTTEKVSSMAMAGGFLTGFFRILNAPLAFGQSRIIKFARTVESSFPVITGSVTKTTKKTVASIASLVSEKTKGAIKVLRSTLLLSQFENEFISAIIDAGLELNPVANKGTGKGLSSLFTMETVSSRGKFLTILATIAISGWRVGGFLYTLTLGAVLNPTTFIAAYKSYRKESPRTTTSTKF